MGSHEDDPRAGAAAGWWARVRRTARAAAEVYDELYTAPVRAGLEREARRREDVLVTVLFLEALGVDNPASAITVELYPELLAAYHDWHRREGWERAPEAGMCC